MRIRTIVACSLLAFLGACDGDKGTMTGDTTATPAAPETTRTVTPSTPHDTAGPVAGTNYVAEVVETIPHDHGAFTQGLELHDGVLFESTGMVGSSSIRRVEPNSGRVLQKVDVPAPYFAEGLTIMNGKAYQLTWQNGICLTYDPSTLRQVGTYSYTGEGWGLTHDDKWLIMSDGTSRIRFMDPATFAERGSIEVKEGTIPVAALNELEYVKGEIWANVWQTDRIVRIDPTSGSVRGWIDLSGVRAQLGNVSVDVLNGIAYDEASGRILVTGKWWPKMFAIRLVPAGQPLASR